MFFLFFGGFLGFFGSFGVLGWMRGLMEGVARKTLTDFAMDPMVIVPLSGWLIVA